MKQNKLKKFYHSIHFTIYVVYKLVKHKIMPEKQVLMAKALAMDLYAGINSALDREEQIFTQIDELNFKAKNCSIKEIKNFDFDLFKVRFQGDYLVLCGAREILKQNIFTVEDSDTFSIYSSFSKHLKECESELNLKIELMRIIRNFEDLSDDQISKEMIKDFKIRAKHILEG